MASTQEAPSLGLTPPYRIGQSSTHVYVEAHCADTPAGVQPEAACDDTIFALRCPPYYLPLHFPAPLKPTLAIHKQGSVVRVDLEKETADLDFVGLDDLQPTLFVDDDGSNSASRQTRRDDAQQGAEAQEMLASVLHREKMTEVDEGSDKSNKGKAKKGPAILSPLDLDESTRRANAQRAEQQEDESFDEQGYLDAYVDEDGHVAELERTQWSIGASVEPSSSTQDANGSAHPLTLPLLLDLLLAHHLTLTHFGGPPLSSSSAYLLCSLSRTLSRPSPAPPSSPQEAVRSAFRRGLAFAPHSSWKLCERALRDALATLQTAHSRRALAGVLHDVDECLQLAGQEEPEGPDEAERCRRLGETLTRARMQEEVARLDEGALAGLADEVGAMLAQIESAKAHVGPKWDLELLEKMADEVVQEERGQSGADGESRDVHSSHEEEEIIALCASLEPPHALALRLDDPAGLSSGPSSPAQDQRLQEWRLDEAPRLLRSLERQVGLLAVREKTRRAGQARTDNSTALETSQTMAQVLITTSRFLKSHLPWSDPSSQFLARRILSHLLARPASLLFIIEAVLSTYVRPLFLSIDGGGPVDDTTGRLRARRVGVTSGTAVRRATIDDDEVAWKGTRQQTQDRSGDDLVQSRGAGVHLTLQACLEGVSILHPDWEKHRRSQSSQPPPSGSPITTPNISIPGATISNAKPPSNDGATISPWDHLWALLLPPLLSLAEDSAPPWRLRGAQLLVTHVFASPHPLRLLRAANLVPHLRGVLESDLTYLSSNVAGVGVKLLDVALKGLRILAAQEDGEQAKDHLMRLVQDGVLRVWSMAPASLTALDVDVNDFADDLLATTFRHFSLILSQLGRPYTARYVDVGLDVLLASVRAVQPADEEAPTVGSQARAKARWFRKCRRAEEALRAGRALLEGCLLGPDVALSSSATSSSSCPLPTSPPGLSRWLSRALDAHVRAWLALRGHDDREGGDEKVSAALREELHRSWKVWQRVPPLREATSLSVKEMERRVLAALVSDDDEEQGRLEAEDVRRNLFGR